MHITLKVPQSDDDSESQGSDDQQQSQDTQQDQQQSQDTQQDQQSQQSDPVQVSADFKASMDSYEQFFDQYVEFMKYEDSGDSVSMLADYTKMMVQYSDTMNKLNAIDQNSLSAADEAYYIEVMGRITQKLASVA